MSRTPAPDMTGRSWSVDHETLVGTKDGSVVRFVLIPAPGVDREGAREAIEQIARLANEAARKLPIREAILEVLRSRPEERWTATSLALAVGSSLSTTAALLRRMEEAGDVVIDRTPSTKAGRPVRLAAS